MVDTNDLISSAGETTMVTKDTGLPDPDNPENEIRGTNDILMLTDDEDDSDDQETIILDEYELLAMEDIVDVHNSSSEDEDHAVDVLSNSEPSTNSAIPPITPMEEALIKEVWSAPPPKMVDIEMDSKRVDEVKQVMMNITLPPSAIPDWATNIPEEEWKNQLLKRLKNMQEEGK